MKRYFLLLAASAALLVTSCSPFQVRTDYAETAHFTDYKTYQFRVDDLKINDLEKAYNLKVYLHHKLQI